MPENADKPKWSSNLVAITVGWALTVASFIWAIASKDADYSNRIERIEIELVDLDKRMSVSENFSIEIKTSLAQIQTDLLWIRKQLEGL